MKKFIVIIFSILLISQNLNAAGICVFKMGSDNGMIAATSTGTEYGNRGYWVAGSSGCSAENMSCKKVYARGEAHCSASGYWPADNWEEYGARHCFCRITHIVSSNGLLTPVAGVWIHKNHQDIFVSSRCSTACAGWCANINYDRNLIKKFLIQGVR